MLETILSAVIVILVLIRVTRLVAWVQQKEYRWDRLVLFLRTKEGRWELFRIVPSFSEMLYFRYKRPHLTLRAQVTLFMALVLTASLTVGMYLVVPLVWALSISMLSLPLVVAVTGVVPSVAKEWYTEKLLRKAHIHVARVNPFIVGITGSYGKTTTKLLLAHVLSVHDAVFYTPFSVNTPLAVARVILEKYSGEHLMILEFAAYKTGEIARLARYFKPHIAILTGLTEQHVGLFGSLAGIRKAKSELITALPTKAQVIVASTGAEEIFREAHRADLEVLRVRTVKVTGALTPEGYLEITHGGIHWRTNLVGMHSLENVQTVCAAAYACGLPISESCARIARFIPSHNFLRIRSGMRESVCIDDGGTSNYQGCLAALAVLQHVAARQKVMVFGGIIDAGERSSWIHTELASVVARQNIECWYVGQVGKDEFVQQLGENCVTDEQEIRAKMGSLTATSAVLIEGRMPSWISI